MNKVQQWLGRVPAKVALFLYLGIGLFQFLVIPAGLEAWFGLHWMIGALCAAVLAWIPLVGQGVGLAAVVTAWHWPVAPAAALFLWPVWFALVMLAVRYLKARRSGEVFNRRFGAVRDEHPASRNSIGDIPPHARRHRPIRSV